MTEKGLKNPVNGEEVDQKFLQSFYPKPEKNMKWLYSMDFNIQGIQIKGEMIMEVIEINGDKVKIKTTLGDNSFESSTTFDKFSPVPSQPGTTTNLSGFRFEIQEDLKVPYGILKDTVKLSSLQNNNLQYLWLSKDIGPVKFDINSSGVPATLELKEFSK